MTAPVLAAWLAVVRVVVILGLRMRAPGTSFPLFEGSFSFGLSLSGLFIAVFFTGPRVSLIIQLLEILYFLVQL